MGRVGHHLESGPARPLVRRRRRLPRATRVEQRLVEPEDVDARPRESRQRVEVRQQRAVVNREPFGHQDKRFRPVDRRQAGQEIAQPLKRPVASAAGPSRGQGKRILPTLVHVGHTRTGPGELRAHGGRVAHGQGVERRGGQQLLRRVLLLRLSVHPGNRLPDLLAVRRERRRQRASAKANRREPIVGRQAIEKGLHRQRQARSAARPDVQLIDGEHDQPPVGRLFVRAVALGQRRRPRRTRPGAERHPLGRQHASWTAVDTHAEVARPQVQHGLTPAVNHRDVHRQHIDPCLEPRRRLRCGGHRHRLLRQDPRRCDQRQCKSRDCRACVGHLAFGAR